MKFSLASTEPKSRPHGKDFTFELETPRGHFFALLDFAAHDYANLNATLKSKLETIVGSFVSLSRFSAELFLGFMAKEINNFLYKLGEQSGGPELLAGGALCLVSGNRLSYFLCGDVQINIANNGRLLPLFGVGGDSSGATATIQRLGANNQEAPLNDVVQSFTLQDADAVLVATHSFQQGISREELSKELSSLDWSEPRRIADSLLKSGSANDGCSVIVITAPYEKFVDPVLTDLSKAIAALESRMEAAENKQNTAASRADFDQRFTEQFEILKDDLKAKAAKIDLMELDGKLKNLSEAIARKPDAAALDALAQKIKSPSATLGEVSAVAPTRRGTPLAAVLALVLGTAVLGSVVGGWMQSRRDRKPAEVWSVKSEPGQITVSRLDGEPSSVTIATTASANSGEQHFSSFADAKRYIDALTNQPATAIAPATAASPGPTASPDQTVSEITIKSGDSLKKLAAQYNVPQEKLMELNPDIKRWTVIRIGQRIVVPASSAVTPATPAPPIAANQQTEASATSTTEIVVGPGDSLNRLAAKYRTTPERLRELNPQITNWATIFSGQKVVVPTPPAA